MSLDPQARLELEAAAYRRLVEHLRKRTDVQNIDLMNLAGFCRNCLSKWMKEESDQKGLGLSLDETREAVYGMPYDAWKQLYQREAAPDQQHAQGSVDGLRRRLRDAFVGPVTDHVRDVVGGLALDAIDETVGHDMTDALGARPRGQGC